MVLAAWLHDLSPWALRLGGGMGLRWYGLSYVAGFAIAWALLGFMARRRMLAVAPERVGDVVLAAIVGVLVGGRLGYCVFYEPSLLVRFDGSPPWWGLLKINQGGMASHGGMAGVILATWWMARRLVDPAQLAPEQRAGIATVGRRMRHVLDAMALAVPPGLLLGRLANFINGELLGEVVSRPEAIGGRATPPWWAVRFPQEIEDEYLRRLGELRDRPAMLDDAAWARLEGVVERSGLWRAGDGFLDAWPRVVERIQQGQRDLATQIEPFIAARYPSQLFQALAEGVVLGLVLWWIARRPRTPGVLGCWFLIVYGALRIVTELWRLPDAQLAVQRLAGLSRGQWLSVFMVAAGVLTLAIILRWGGGRVGGWTRGASSATTPGSPPRSSGPGSSGTSSTGPGSSGPDRSTPASSP